MRSKLHRQRMAAMLLVLSCAASSAHEKPDGTVPGPLLPSLGVVPEMRDSLRLSAVSMPFVAERTGGRRGGRDARFAGGRAPRPAGSTIEQAFPVPGASGRFSVLPGIAQPRATLASLVVQTELDLRRSGLIGKPGVSDFLAALKNPSAVSSGIDASLKRRIGLTLSELKDDVELEEVIYPIGQVIAGTPVEFSLLVASRASGERSFTSLEGSFIARHVIDNKPRLALSGVVAAGRRAVSGWVGLPLRLTDERPRLVLLPVGANRTEGKARLRFAWRLTFRGVIDGELRDLTVWLDAQDGVTLLRTAPPKAIGVATVDAPGPAASAVGRAWQASPQGVTVERAFEVDRPARGAAYGLQLQGLSRRIDSANDGDGTDSAGTDVLAPPSAATATPLADFRATGAADASDAMCRRGDRGFAQVNLFVQMFAFRQHAVALGTYQPFPASDWRPAFPEDCAAHPGAYGACPGYFDPACPNAYSPSAPRVANYLHHGHDNTIVTHELAHRMVKRIAQERPAGSCGAFGCSNRAGLDRLHDLADAWADHLMDTNCTGGWVAKNVGGVDASRDCKGSRGHTDGPGLPRLHELKTPFDALHPGDHFPEHRARSDQRDDYADMQIAAAALWQVREGLRSLEPASTHLLYAVHLFRAIRNMDTSSAAFGTPPTADPTDREVYRLLYELEYQLVKQWAQSGPPPASGSAGRAGSELVAKVTSGFARAGLFLIPPECLDPQAARHSTSGLCITGDAVIDVAMPTASGGFDDESERRAQSAEARIDGPSPMFHVWTGPRYGFRGNAALPVTAVAACHRYFRVELSAQADFSQLLAASEWSTVPVDNELQYPAQCYGQWRPDASQWLSVQSAGVGAAIHFRVLTRNEEGSRLVSSLEPAGGTWRVRPPVFSLSAAPEQ